ncbi:molybdopterin-binding protein [Pelotomaculum terephthalicicum JT]|uniref:molybdopterin-binding protein n=1 Tax=Pelotomaculum terephthalicicum TaxID=206393 RepID=UPI001F04B3B5|nr:MULTISPECIES: molybdopterin-binding protein [Pelotomaculum]MCG9967663.1 molybdopterin-binding protein [Pelotomaculum terephthalicicum JT]
MLSSIGVTHVAVIPPRSVGIISTGDELVAPSKFPAPGQVRDINSYTLFGAVAACGGEPHCYGIVGDYYKELRNVLERVIAENDIVLLFRGKFRGRAMLPWKQLIRWVNRAYSSTGFPSSRESRPWEPW